MEKIKTPIKEIEIRELNGNGQVFNVPEQVYEPSKLELEAIRNTIEPFRLSVEKFDLIEIKMPNIAFCWSIIINELNLIQVVDIVENVGYIHTVDPIVIKSASTRYAIGNLAIADNRVQNGIIVTRFDPGIPCIASELNVYTSLRKLKKIDPLFRQLTTKQKQKVLKESNINGISDFIFARASQQLDGHLVQHLFLGSFRKGSATGVHHTLAIKRGEAKILEVTKPPNKLGVWEAKIQVLDRSNKQTKTPLWKVKDKPSTFFPDDWNTVKLLDECEFALKNKELVREKHGKTLWKSKTSSDIPVEIWINKDQRPESIYPICELD